MNVNAKSHPLTRRHVLGAASLALPWMAARPVRAQDASIKLCQSTALTGPLGDLGSAMHKGAQAAFAVINRQGGIHGRQILLDTKDDGYDLKRSQANVDAFLADRDCFALFNCMGSAMVQAMIPKVRDSGMPLFAPFTGGQLSRIAGARNIFNIRASYVEEAEQSVQHLATIGLHKIAVVYQNNAFGKEALAGAVKAMQAAKLPEAPTTTVEDNASDAATAAQKIADTNPKAVILGLAGKPALEFIKAFRPMRPGVTPYALSVLGTTGAINALGAQGTGLVISQVVPLPTGTMPSVVREFQTALKAFDAKADPSHLALEGYINARACAEALQRAGRNLTRQAFIDATWTLRKMDLGGFEINASVPERNASRFVELTMVNRDGRFIR